MAIQRIYFYADDETDAAVFAWLAGQSNRSESIRGLICAAAGQPAPGASLDETQLRRVLREELSRLVAGAAQSSAPAGEDDELRDALDGLASAWQFEGERS